MFFIQTFHPELDRRAQVSRHKRRHYLVGAVHAIRFWSPA